MYDEYYDEYEDGEYVLAHHGILGQKWGVRRYQNADGTLTDAGKRRYMTGDRIDTKRRALRPDDYRTLVEESIRGKDRDSATKSLRKEARALGEEQQEEMITLTSKIPVITAISTAAIGATVGGILAGPAGAIGVGYAGAVAGAVGSGVTGTVKSIVDSNKYTKLNNVLADYYDEYNITPETKRVLNT